MIRVFHEVSLVAFLAWVGLGADGLKAVLAYGPEEAYLALAEDFSSPPAGYSSWR